MSKEVAKKEEQNLLQVQVKITNDDIKKYFCPLATEKEGFMALGIIKSLNLNPFKKEVHLIKYNLQSPISIVVGYEVYLKRAERTGKLDGWEQGLTEDGTRAWVRIYRKDWKIPFYWEVSLKEFSKNQATWNQIPDFMGRKVAIAQGFRLAFPDELGGMPYTKEEYQVYDVVVESPTMKPAIDMPEAIKPGEETTDKEESAEEKSDTPTPKKSTNFELLKQAAEAKKSLGDGRYYQLLYAFKANHANELSDEDLKAFIVACRVDYQKRQKALKKDKGGDL